MPRFSATNVRQFVLLCGLQEPTYGYASFVRWGIRLLELIAEIVGDLDQWKYVEELEKVHDE